MNQGRSVAILGAGMAGATAARRIADAGLAVRVFDKGTDVGGRMATRDPGGRQFDHGAQFMRAHSPAFAARLAAWDRRGLVAPWGGDGRWVGIPGMTAPVRDLLVGLSVARATTIVRVERDRSGWRLADESGAVHGPFDALALTIPAPQAAALLEKSAVALPGVASASYAPCWSLMIAVDQVPAERVLHEFGIQGSSIQGSGDPISLVAVDSSKPGRPPGARLTVHATADWSHRHLEETRDAVIAALVPALCGRLGVTIRPTHAAAHRWRYAQVETALGRPCLYDPALRLGAAGDWCLGARIEAAHDSGLALAEAILADLGAAA